MSDEKEKLLLYPLEGFAPPLNHALAWLEEARERTLLTVADLSVEMLDSYATGFPNSIGSLLYHIAGIELDWLFSEILEQDFPENLLALFPVDARDETGKLSVIAGVELPDHLQRLAQVRAALLGNLKDMTEEDFYRIRSLSDYDVNSAWVLNHLLQHEAKHREQIARIRRSVE